ncbi:hypothetical protein BDZ89DRAFT_650270 [Hymenopellis radicata]|nr:hypothetical protein BDZ89DRAFT_650270 [Hymenopellis radicata]
MGVPFSKPEVPVILTLGEQRVLVPRYLVVVGDYEVFFQTVADAFHIPKGQSFEIQTTTFPGRPGAIITVPSCAWDDFIAACPITELFVKRKPLVHDPPLQYSITVKYMFKTIVLKVRSNESIASIKQRLYWMEDGTPDTQILVFPPTVLLDIHTLRDYSIVEGSVLHLIDDESKPFISICSPIEQKIRIRLTLDSHLEFSGVYPPAPTQHVVGTSSFQYETTWSVMAHSTGLLTDPLSGEQCTCLRWKAIPQEDVQATEAYQLACTVDDSNGVLVARADFKNYLTRALALFPESEEKSTFITRVEREFMSGGTHALLRFVPQEAFDNLARIDVVPTPDVLARVLIVGCVLPNDEFSPLAKRRAAENPMKVWRNVLQPFDKERLGDETLFRVFEMHFRRVTFRQTLTL